VSVLGSAPLKRDATSERKNIVKDDSPDALCDAIRRLSPVAATNALNDLRTTTVLNETDECIRAINLLRDLLVKKRDAKAKRL
jgi:hypothetical protein